MAIISVSLSSWVQIRDVALSERQLRALLRMRRLYLKNLGAMLCRRQELSAKLQARRGTPQLRPCQGQALPA